VTASRSSARATLSIGVNARSDAGSVIVPPLDLPGRSPQRVGGRDDFLGVGDILQTILTTLELRYGPERCRAA
jgi:hypothetical protein